MEKCNILECDVYQAIKIIKSRYASVFIFSLEEQAKTFSEIEAEFSFINSVQVTRTLKHLQVHNLVTKQNNLYQLTAAGNELIPIFNSLEAWNEKHIMK